jgi:hypothetical protein
MSLRHGGVLQTERAGMRSLGNIQGTYMKRHLVGVAIAALSVSAAAADLGYFVATGGYGSAGSNFSLGGGSKADLIELSSIDLGTVEGTSSAKFTGLSLVQNAAPIKNFNLLFRLGFGRATTTFADGTTASRVGFSKGVFLGLGEQYQLNGHLALLGELNRITYASSHDGSSHGIRYPLTISVLYSF